MSEIGVNVAISSRYYINRQQKIQNVGDSISQSLDYEFIRYTQTR